MPKDLAGLIFKHVRKITSSQSLFELSLKPGLQRHLWEPVDIAKR